MLITSVSGFLSLAPPRFPCLHPILSVTVCHFVLGIICCSVWMLRRFPWELMGKNPGSISCSFPKVLGPWVSLPPDRGGPPLPLSFPLSLYQPLLLLCPFLSSFPSKLCWKGALWSPMRWGQRCSRLKRTLQIEFTLDETNRFACVYPPETGWPAPGKELSHLWTV